MKNIARILLTISILFPALALADSCTNPADCPANGNPYLVMEPWGLTREQSQKYFFPDGASITLKDGSVFTCPWFYPAGCLDLRWYYGT
jgi:hypothetical protein